MCVFLERPIEGDWPYLWIDATNVKTREDEPFWTKFLRSISRRALRGAKLGISNSHEGTKAAVPEVLKAKWQHCRVHFMRNALAHAPKTQRRMVCGAIATVFAHYTARDAREQWCVVANQLCGKFATIGSLMDTAEHEALVYMDFPNARWLKIQSTNPLERLNAEIKRRTNMVCIFPNDRTITQLAGAMLLEQSDKSALQRRYMQLEGLQTLSDTAPARMPAVQR